jgi:hypothetical protein
LDSTDISLHRFDTCYEGGGQVLNVGAALVEDGTGMSPYPYQVAVDVTGLANPHYKAEAGGGFTGDAVKNPRLLPAANHVLKAVHDSAKSLGCTEETTAGPQTVGVDAKQVVFYFAEKPEALAAFERCHKLLDSSDMRQHCGELLLRDHALPILGDDEASMRQLLAQVTIAREEAIRQFRERQRGQHRAPPL